MPVHVLQDGEKVALCNGGWKGILKEIGSIFRGHQVLPITFHYNDLGLLEGATPLRPYGFKWY